MKADTPYLPFMVHLLTMLLLRNGQIVSQKAMVTNTTLFLQSGQTKYVMRYCEILENITHWPKPYAVVTFDEDSDLAHVFRNPPAELLKRIIGRFDCRALLDHNGILYAWPELNCYHDDVSNNLDIGYTISLMLTNPASPHDHAKVCVKGVNSAPEPLSDEDILKLLHTNRGLVSLYGENFAVDSYDWG
jgi:hypothetical protein